MADQDFNGSDEKVNLENLIRRDWNENSCRNNWW